MAIAVLNPQFFQDHAPSVEFFHQWKNYGPWSDSLIPIYQWDGILFIATSSEVQPEIAVPHMFVTAEPTKISELWNLWQSPLAEAPTLQTISGEIEIPNLAELPTQIDIETKEESVKTATQIKDSSTAVEENIFDMDELAKVNAAPAEKLTQTVLTVETPEGIAMDSNLNQVDANALEGLSIPTSEISENVSNVPDGISMEAAAPKLQLVPNDLEKTEAIPPSSAEVTTTVAAKIPAPVISDDLTPNPIHTNSTLSSTKNATSALTVTGAIDLEMNDILDKLNAHFRQSMILFAVGDQAKPWRWSESFSATDTKQSIDISQPSPLRVVYRTNKSYYGPIKPSLVMDEFSKNWLKGQTPTELSVAPILVNDKLVGIILCNGNQEPESLEPLKFLERVSEEASERIQANPDHFQVA